MSIRLSAVLICASVIVSLALPAQASDNKTNIVFSCQCDDNIGRAFGRSFRDLLAKSPRYHELSDTKENRKSAVTVQVVSLEEKVGSEPTGADALATVFLLDNYYLDQLVQACGTNRPDTCAQTLFDNLDEDVNALKKAFADK